MLRNRSNKSMMMMGSGECGRSHGEVDVEGCRRSLFGLNDVPLTETLTTRHRHRSLIAWLNIPCQSPANCYLCLDPVKRHHFPIPCFIPSGVSILSHLRRRLSKRRGSGAYSPELSFATPQGSRGGAREASTTSRMFPQGPVSPRTQNSASEASVASLSSQATNSASRALLSGQENSR